MRRTIISFLGTGNYLECRYKLTGSGVSSTVCYAQTAITSLVEKVSGVFDRRLILCTPHAEKKHWDGLSREFERNGLTNIEIVRIPDGSDEKKLWDIFTVINNEIEENERLVVDVTHSFRSLPVIMTILLQYLKTTKNVDVSGLYYGAFEKLGDFNVVKEIPADNRIVPIFDLTPFLTLFDWSRSIDLYVRTGRTTLLQKQISKEISPILKESAGKDKNAASLRAVINAIGGFAENIQFCQGGSISKINFEHTILEPLAEIEENFLPPFAPLIERLREVFKGYKDSDTFNVVRAAKWCADRGIFQQAFTLLQEACIELVYEEIIAECVFHEQFYISEGNKLTDVKAKRKKEREFVSAALNVLAKDIPSESWREHITCAMEQIQYIKKKFNANFFSAYKDLTQIRNNLNHAGFVESLKSQFIINKFEELFSNLVQMERS